MSHRGFALYPETNCIKLHASGPDITEGGVEGVRVDVWVLRVGVLAEGGQEHDEKLKNGSRSTKANTGSCYPGRNSLVVRLCVILSFLSAQPYTD
ncbi:hypothetical protein CIB48_g3275 [Xylaria polymorpha]|nr:hypothetical protein CIB48_g3275 [Xylaria polymorpha]